MKTIKDVDHNSHMRRLLMQKDGEIAKLKQENDYLKSRHMHTQKNDLVIHLNNDHQIVCRFKRREQADAVLEEIFEADRKK